jgi:2-desacetyl-2-hydroxyethyl bacteriochlorophyllide A dehydrogenase
VRAPSAAPGEVLVRATVVGICGSDLHAALGRHPFIPLPYRPGHEVVGVVESVGEGVDETWRGRRVVLEPNLYCGQCAPCVEGRYNICERLDVFGCQTPGGMTDLFAVPVHRLHVLPDNLSDTAAALVEPLSTPVRAVRRAGDVTGRRVVVLGAGPIGVMVLLSALRAGAASVVVADLVASKRERALRFGAAGVFDASAPDAVAQARALLGGPADVVFDAVARDSSIAQGIDLLRKGGKLVVIGVSAGATPVPLDLVQDRELDILGTLMFVGEDMREAIAMLAEGAVPVQDMITATFDITRAGEAFAASADPEQLKVLVTVGAPEPDPEEGSRS